MTKGNISNQVRLPKGSPILDPETGEVVGELHDDYTAKSQSLIDSQRKYLELKEDLIGRKDCFSLVGTSVLSDSVAQKLLVNKEIVFIITILSKYICPYDNTLRVGGNFNGRPITAMLLSELEGVPYSTIGNMIASLKKKRVLALAYTGGEAGYDVVGCKNEKSEVLYMNPFIASKGKVKTGIWTLFVGSIWEELYNKNCK